MRGNLLGARRRAINSGSRGGGSREWRQELGWSTELKNLRDSCSLRSAKVGIFATYSAEVYGTSFVRENMIRIANVTSGRSHVTTHEGRFVMVITCKI